MASKEENAQLSLYVYNVLVRDDNRPLVPDGWERLEYQRDDGFGFSYGVFRGLGTTEVVVAYAGTNAGIDWLANIQNGVGLSSTQTTQAALAYLHAKEQYGSNITFTGHSLGGGLASIMAVWFDRPAVVFDEAPFQRTAVNPLAIGYTQTVLELAGFDIGAFDTYNPVFDFGAREANVSNYYTPGELLLNFRFAWNTIVGATDEDVPANVVDMVASLDGRWDLHSQALLTALVLTPSFGHATDASTRVLPLLMDKSFYAYDAETSNQQNVLINFIRSEQGAGDKLTHFAADLQKLGTDLSIAAQNALIAQGIEWYYWQDDANVSQEFFTKTGSLLQYTTAAGAGLQSALNKAASYVDDWLTPIADAHGERYSSSFATAAQWNVASNSAAVTATARDASKDQIFIGNAGGDTFTGGDRADVIFGGDGADTVAACRTWRAPAANRPRRSIFCQLLAPEDPLWGCESGRNCPRRGQFSLRRPKSDRLPNGGAGNDGLYGGAGTDTYNFPGIFGFDIVADSDSLGLINVDGVQLTGGKGDDLLPGNTTDSEGRRQPQEHALHQPRQGHHLYGFHRFASITTFARNRSVFPWSYE